MNTRQNNRSKKLVQRSNTPDALENGHSQDALCTSQKLEQVPSHDAPKPLAQIVDMNERREEQEGARGKKNRLEIIDENDAPVPLQCIAVDDNEADKKPQPDSTSTQHNYAGMHHSATREPLINPEYSPTGSSRARNSVVSAQFRVYQVQATPVQTVEGTLIRDEPSLPVHNAVLVETRRERFRKWYSARRQSIAGMIESIP